MRYPTPPTNNYDPKQGRLLRAVLGILTFFIIFAAVILGGLKN